MGVLGDARDLFAITGVPILPAYEVCGPVSLSADISPAPVWDGPTDEQSLLRRAIESGNAVRTLTIRSQIEVDLDDSVRSKYGLLTNRTEADIEALLAANRFTEAVNAAILCAQIASPGSSLPTEFVWAPQPLELEKPKRKAKNVEVIRRLEHMQRFEGVPALSGIPGRADGFGLAAFTAREINWPILEELSSARVLEWLSRLAGWRDGLLRGKVGRAVACASRILADQSWTSPLAMIWALMGLESIYCPRRDGIQGQLLANSQSFLGDCIGNARAIKMVKTMYDYRSRVVHGDLDLPLAFRREPEDYDKYDEFRSFASKLKEAENLSVALLVASIQQFVIRDWQDIEFQTVAARP